MKKPIIGIVMKHYLEGHSDDTVIHGTIKRAILEMGGLGIGIVPPCAGKVRSVDQTAEARLNEKEKADLIAQISLCDGIVLQGGGFNDAYEVFIAKYCMEHRIPTLGICAGFFNMIRAAGGKSTPLDELEFARHKDQMHTIHIHEAYLQKIMGCKTVITNSRHRSKAVNRGSLTWAAKAEDGIPEAAFLPGQFYLAVQFHPEDMMDQPSMRRIFEAFIKHAAGK